MSRPRGLPAALLAGVVALAGPASSQDLRVETITRENAAELQIGGPDAIGGVDDVYLANDRIRLVIDHPKRRYAKLNHGGTIVDVGLTGRHGDDQFARLIPLVNLSQRVVIGYDEIHTELVPGERARVVVRSPGMSSIPRGSALSRHLDPLVPDPASLRDVRVETTYEVRPGEPFVRIVTRFENTGATPAPVFAYGDLWMRGGHGPRAFLGNVLAPGLARGFHQRSFSRDLLGSLDALAPLSYVVAAGLPPWPPIAYALYSPERSARGLSFFGVTGEHVSLAMALHADPGWRELGVLRLLRALRDTLAPSEVWEIRRRLLVTGTADVGSATDRILVETGAASGTSGLEGRSDPPDVRTVVHVDTAAGFPVTQLAARAGRYAATLPPGDYRLTLRAPQRAAQVRRVRVAPGATAQVPEVHWPALGALRLAPAFADGGPGRVVFRGRDGTPDPVFGAELLDFRIDGVRPGSATETSAVPFLGNAHDPAEIPLAAGRYTLVATRGLEYDAAVREVLVRAGAVTPVAPFELHRIASLPDSLSADFHVHSQASDDSGATNEERLRDFVAAGVSLLVATDHDHVADYGPALAALDLAGRIQVVRGVEVTSSTPSEEAPWTIGHHNAWPLELRPWQHRGGAPPSQRMRVAELYSLLRRDYGVHVVQLNHPRPKESGANAGNFFTHQGSVGRPVDPRLPITWEGNESLLWESPDGTRAIDFDAIEVMNGKSRAQYLATRRDFHWLLRQGYRRTATANTDTHGPDQLAGMPRNYVRVGRDRRDPEAVDEALKAGRSFGTNGPLLVRFSVNGALAGDTVAAVDSRVRVRYEVVSAPWVPVDEVRVLVDGEVVRALPERSGQLDLRLARDAFVTLEAGAPLDADPAVWFATHRGLYTEAIAPGHIPTAFSNPIYVDADGDGRWTAPGLAPARDGSGRWPVWVALLAALGSAWLWRRTRLRAVR